MLVTSASCKAGVARIMAYTQGIRPSCSTLVYDRSAQCTAGCAVEFSEQRYGITELDDVAPEAFCADTPQPLLGDSCGNSGPCMPTRAQIADDGTVIGQTYLVCNGSTCVATTPPTAGTTFQPCDPTLVSQYDQPGTNGIVGRCLIAWDASAQAIKSGLATACYGDWQCGPGTLCDDQVPALGESTALPVCKPGPRGVLTPEMLTP